VHQQFGLAAAGLTMAPRRKVSAQHNDAVVFLQRLLPRGDDVGVPEWVSIDSFDEGAAGHGDRSRVEQIGDLGKGAGGPPNRRAPAQSPCAQARIGAKVQHMEDGYTQLGTVLTDQRPEDSEGDGVIVVGRFRGDPYDGVQLSYEAGRRNLYLTPEGALRLAFLLAAAVERDIDIR
jgi:hypothetical protein